MAVKSRAVREERVKVNRLRAVGRPDALFGNMDEQTQTRSPSPNEQQGSEGVEGDECSNE
jgi:hypothetical protein